MWRIVATVLALATLNACTATVEPPKAKVVIVPAISADPPPQRGFCPPGLAKQGRC